MRLHELVKFFEQIAPLHYAEAWDNVGLLCGDGNREIARLLLCIDCTDAVLKEAKQKNCDVVMSYHPPIFQGVKKLLAGNVVYDAISSGIALYSMHTALDAAPGGTNDVLADLIGLIERRPLRAYTAESHFKLVVFVPLDHLEKLSEALWAAGAGRIGDYASCSFRSGGQGTFWGGEKSNPTIGERGRLEKVAEQRLETLVPVKAVPAVIDALKANHPYEEPAFDLLRLAPPPSPVGMGRIGELKYNREELLEKLRAAFAPHPLLVAGPTSGKIKRVAVCAGAAGEFIDDALREKADLLLAGEVRHHDALKAARRGLTIVATLHSNSERLALPALARRLAILAPELPVLQSENDADPFRIF